MSAGTRRGAPVAPQGRASPAMRGSGGAEFFSAWALSNHANLAKMAQNRPLPPPPEMGFCGVLFLFAMLNIVKMVCGVLFGVFLLARVNR